MNRENKSSIGKTLALTLLLAVTMACSGYGTKLEFNGGEVYYTKNATEAEARKLGEYLVKEQFFDGKPKTVQLDKSGSTYQVRMVVQAGKEKDEPYVEIVKTAAQEFSRDVFNNAPTEVHLCDERLKTLRVVTP